MEVAVQKAINSRARNEVKELYLDNQCRTSKPAGLEDFSSLTFLSLNNIGLTSLEGLPRLPKLTTLETSDNMISTGLSVLANATPRLEVLKLGGNRLANFKDLESLSRLKNLRVLDLYGNPVTNSVEYREKVFGMIPSLEVLDGADKEGNEVGTEDEEEEDEEEEGEEGYTENDIGSMEDDDYDQIDSVLSKTYGRIPRDREVSEDESLEDVEDNSEVEEVEGNYAKPDKDLGEANKALMKSSKKKTGKEDEEDIGLNGKQSQGRFSHAATKKNAKGARGGNNKEEDEEEDDREEEEEEEEDEDQESDDEEELGGSFGSDDSDEEDEEEEDDDDDDDDEEDDDEEGFWNSEDDEDEENDEDEEEGEDDEEEDQEIPLSKKRRAKETTKQKAKAVSKGRGGGGLRAAANKRRRSDEVSSDEDDDE